MTDVRSTMPPSAKVTIEGRRAQRVVAISGKSAEKRLAIIRAATEIINLKSYALATMTEIAARLDLRDGTLYYYFPGKRALAFACHVASLERFEALLATAVAEGGAGALRLRGFIRCMLEDSDRNGPQLYFGDRSYLEAEERNAIDVWAARITASLEELIGEGVDDGSIIACEPRLVVQLLLGMLIWLAKWVPAVEGMTVDRLMDAIDTVTLRGLEANMSSGRQPRRP